ncbi:RNA-directed DNA polymerase (Reverse transcriptase) [Trifolium medium]|uniref:RNA-directed DNA polymerase (Reverse transcriptase) n=1 Tax=Trifolium medium TaxID=97028 RepID=A0A392M2L8_9FABA|nr:RNA-directed DNA polymerase (Reverse transcriptase) [Trifolium medium]
MLFIRQDILPEDRDEATKLRRIAAKYTIVNGKLYKMGFSTLMLLCLGKDESKRLLAEIHDGECGSHIGARALAAEVMRAGFYWPKIMKDSTEYVRSCDKCQRHANIHHSPAETLQSVTSPWPFLKWGVDILGPFTTAANQVKFLIVAINYFTKWIEAEPVATIGTEKVKNFYWKRIMCRYGIPKNIVSDNGKQFTSELVIEFCEQHRIQNTFVSVEHPQANGQAESANKVILMGIKKRLDKEKK